MCNGEKSKQEKFRESLLVDAQNTKIKIINIEEIDLNNSFFHFTTRNNLESIENNGLIPGIGGASQMKNEAEARVYMSKGGKGIIEIKNSFIHEFKKLKINEIPDEYRKYFDITNFESDEVIDEKLVYSAMVKKFKDEIYFKIDAKEGEDFLIEDSYADVFKEDFSMDYLREEFNQHPQRDVKGKANHVIEPEKLSLITTSTGSTALDVVQYLYNRLLENARKMGSEDAVKWKNSDLDGMFEYVKQQEKETSAEIDQI